MTKEEQLQTNRLRKRKCKTCKEWFRPVNDIQRTCMTAECSVPFAKENLAKEKKKAARESRQNTRSKLKQRAQDACNIYIKARDKGLPCISCGYIWMDGFEEVGRKKNAGHYLSVGKRGDIRYNELNIHLQCELCNSHEGGGLHPDYRPNLIKKIGKDKVEMLESNNVPRSYSDEELKVIEETYKKKTKELECRTQ